MFTFDLAKKALQSARNAMPTYTGKRADAFNRAIQAYDQAISTAESATNHHDLFIAKARHCGDYLESIFHASESEFDGELIAIAIDRLCSAE